MPEAPNAIRIHFDENEPPALVFNNLAHPGALVSWAWGQLTALNALLAGRAETRWTAHEKDITGAVRSVLVPVINALAFAELRAYELKAAGEHNHPSQNT
jgi:hypothetical protein